MNELVRFNIEKMGNQLKQADIAYYHIGQPIMTDEYYDELRRRFQWLVEKYGFEPYSYIGAPVTGDVKKRTRLNPMLSLSNVFNVDDVKRFIKSTSPATYIVEPKIDGMAVELMYIDGELVSLSTRGDGYIGGIVDNKSQYINNIPSKIPYKQKPLIPGLELSIRGEIVIHKSQFDKLNQQNGDKFSNPRNLVAGLLLKHELPEVYHSVMTFYPYDIDGHNCETRLQLIDRLIEYGFTVPKYIYFASENSLLQYISNIDRDRESSQFPFEIDGMVIKVNEMLRCYQLGVGRTYPHHATAFKFPAKSSTGKLKAITWSIGKHGTLTPVAELEPTLVDNVTISRVSLHNWNEIKRLDLCIGDEVTVARAGDVIPKITGVITRQDGKVYLPVSFPNRCPSCLSTTSFDKSSGTITCMGGDVCTEKKIVQLSHFVSRRAMDIKGMGESVIRQLMEHELIHQPDDIYMLHHHYSKLVELFGSKVSDKLLLAIRKSCDKPDSRLLYAMCIRHIGESVADNLVKEIRLDEFFTLSESEMMTLKSLKKVHVPEIYRYVNEMKYGEQYKRLKSNINSLRISDI